MPLQPWTLILTLHSLREAAFHPVLSALTRPLLISLWHQCQIKVRLCHSQERLKPTSFLHFYEWGRQLTSTPWNSPFLGPSGRSNGMPCFMAHFPPNTAQPLFQVAHFIWWEKFSIIQGSLEQDYVFIAIQSRFYLDFKTSLSTVHTQKYFTHVQKCSCHSKSTHLGGGIRAWILH